MAGEGSNGFVAGGDEDPVAKIEAVADFEDGVDGLALVEDVFDGDDAGGVAGEAGDAGLIVDDDDGTIPRPGWSPPTTSAPVTAVAVAPSVVGLTISSD